MLSAFGPLRLLRSVLVALALATFASLAIAANPTTEPAPDEAVFGTHRYIEYDAGDLPIVITSPHGGRLRPSSIPNREEGVVGADTNSQELARALADQLFARTGHHAHLIASQLHRSKLDPNREIKEAAQGSAEAEVAWNEFHAFVAKAVAAAVARHGFAFLIDIHGHAHPIARLELGYALGEPQLRLTDAEFDASDLAALSTLRDLHARLGGSGAALIRGPRSLGTLLTERGLRAVPSAQEPAPGRGAFFNGGYIVRRHAGEPTTTKVDGLQIETHFAGLRDTAPNRTHFGQVVTEALAIFLHERYAYDLPTVTPATTPKK